LSQYLPLVVTTRSKKHEKTWNLLFFDIILHRQSVKTGLNKLPKTRQNDFKNK